MPIPWLDHTLQVAVLESMFCAVSSSFWPGTRLVVLDSVCAASPEFCRCGTLLCILQFLVFSNRLLALAIAAVMVYNPTSDPRQRTLKASLLEVRVTVAWWSHNLILWICLLLHISQLFHPFHLFSVWSVPTSLVPLGGSSLRRRCPTF